MRWEKVPVKPIQAQGEEAAEFLGPGKRWGHTCNAIKGGKLLYVFGGYGRDNCQTNLVHVFDTATQTWSQPVIKGNPPIPRDSHSCTVVGDNLFVFGGTDGTNPLRDLHILDTSSHTWISPDVRGEGPEAREGHSSALVGKRLFVFGGCGKSTENNEVYYNDLYILNTETFVWKCAATSGTPPSPRDSHTCSSWKNKIIVIGGEDRHDYYLSDVHILDTDTLIWRELNTTGQLLTPRAGHSTVSFGKNLFVFGGFTDSQSLYNDLYMLDVDTGLWTKVATAGNSPCARFSVSGDCLDPFMGGVLVFIGGCNKNLEALDDMYYLHTGLAREIELRPEKLSLRKQLKLKCQEQNLNTVPNQGGVRCGTSDVNQPLETLNFNQPSRQNIQVNQSLPLGKKAFQAWLTDSIPDGYTIETVIDGKPLRGFLFSNKPHSLQPPIHALGSRKRMPYETGNAVTSNTRPNKLKVSKVLKSNEMTDVGHGNRSEAVAPLVSSFLTTADPSEPHAIISSNPEPGAVPLNQEDAKKHEAQNSTDGNLNETPCSRTGFPTDDQTNPLQSLNHEVPRHDQTTAPSFNAEVPRHDQTTAPSFNAEVPRHDQTTVSSFNAEVPTHDQTIAPSFNAEVPRPAVAEGAVSHSNQDNSGSAPMEEQRSDLPKSI